MFTTRRVLDCVAGVVVVILDDDGDWQALDGLPRADGDAVVIALASLLDLHPGVSGAVGELDRLGAGWQAVATDEGVWRVEPHHLR